MSFDVHRLDLADNDGKPAITSYSIDHTARIECSQVGVKVFGFVLLETQERIQSWIAANARAWALARHYAMLPGSPLPTDEQLDAAVKGIFAAPRK